MKNIVNSIINWDLWQKVQKPRKIETDYKKTVEELSLEKMVEIRDHLENKIRTYDDGFKYLCKVRSYGRNWTENYTNHKALQDRCWEMNGDDGIIDVYTNNPKLRIENYGAVYYFPSMEDAEKWRNHHYNLKVLESEFEHVKKWEDESIPYHAKPSFPPTHNMEKLLEIRQRLEDEKSSVIEPVILG
jgi:hypothetical protein